MAPLKLRLLMELSPDTIDSINKERKPQQTLLLVFLPGAEVSYTEPSWITSQSSKSSATTWKMQ
jgi:hypothetical protein